MAFLSKHKKNTIKQQIDDAFALHESRKLIEEKKLLDVLAQAKAEQVMQDTDIEQLTGISNVIATDEAIEAVSKEKLIPEDTAVLNTDREHEHESKCENCGRMRWFSYRYREYRCEECDGY